ncbi:MAG: hypothetical protein GWO28_15570 [candidate division Zixibacteria bacterium]|nr:hypothetical protein [candidate division Zixibacteria bacterium]
MKIRRVRGEARVMFTVELPEETATQKVVTDDPADEAVIEGIPQSLDLYLWGRDKKPASVYFEIHEEDIDIEEDEEMEQL